jgi:hypothetical protein
MRVKDCCSYHANHEFAGVVVEIVHPSLKTYYGGNFLMQVHSKLKDSVYYQEVLQCNFQFS